MQECLCKPQLMLLDGMIKHTFLVHPAVRVNRGCQLLERHRLGITDASVTLHQTSMIFYDEPDGLANVPLALEGLPYYEIC